MRLCNISCDNSQSQVITEFVVWIISRDGRVWIVTWPSDVSQLVGAFCRLVRLLPLAVWGLKSLGVSWLDWFSFQLSFNDIISAILQVLVPCWFPEEFRKIPRKILSSLVKEINHLWLSCFNFEINRSFAWYNPCTYALTSAEVLLHVEPSQKDPKPLNGFLISVFKHSS